MAGEKERKHIKVSSVGTPKQLHIGDRDTVVVTFKGEDGIVYEAWEQVLVDLIIAGADLDADVSHGEKDGLPIHRVVQLYDAQGKPVKQSSGKRGGGYRGPAVDSASSESIAAATIMKDIFLAGKQVELTADTSPLVIKLRSWLDPRIARKYDEVGVVQATTPIASPTVKPPTTPETAKATTQTAADKAAAAKSAEDKAAAGKTPPAEGMGEAPEAKPNKVDKTTLDWLYQVAKDKKYERSTVQAIILRMFPPATSSRELSQADAGELIKLLQSGFMLENQGKLEDIPF